MTESTPESTEVELPTLDMEDVAHNGVIVGILAALVAVPTLYFVGRKAARAAKRKLSKADTETPLTEPAPIAPGTGTE